MRVMRFVPCLGYIQARYASDVMTSHSRRVIRFALTLRSISGVRVLDVSIRASSSRGRSRSTRYVY